MRFPGESPRGDVATIPATELDLRRLFALNVLLQVVDGFVTYQALQIGFAEGNPIVNAWFGLVGSGPALLLFKAAACAFLLILRRGCPSELGRRALWSVAVCYAVLAIAPWLGILLSLPWATLPPYPV